MVSRPSVLARVLAIAAIGVAAVAATIWPDQ